MKMGWTIDLALMFGVCVTSVFMIQEADGQTSWPDSKCVTMGQPQTCSGVGDAYCSAAGSPGGSCYFCDDSSTGVQTRVCAAWEGKTCVQSGTNNQCSSSANQKQGSCTGGSCTNLVTGGTCGSNNNTPQCT